MKKERKAKTLTKNDSGTKERTRAKSTNGTRGTNSENKMQKEKSHNERGDGAGIHLKVALCSIAPQYMSP